jgi:isopentenyl-diphosphate delta-isomerase
MLGNYSGDPVINRDEVAAWKWMAVEDVKADIKANPDQYTVWFKIIFDKFYSFIRL